MKAIMVFWPSWFLAIKIGTDKGLHRLWHSEKAWRPYRNYMNGTP